MSWHIVRRKTCGQLERVLRASMPSDHFVTIVELRSPSTIIIETVGVDIERKNFIEKMMADDLGPGQDRTATAIDAKDKKGFAMFIGCNGL